MTDHPHPPATYSSRYVTPMVACIHCGRYAYAGSMCSRVATAFWWLARGLRALAGIEPIRTDPRRN